MVKITESMHGVAVPPTLYSQYNVVVYLCRKKPSLSDRTRYIDKQYCYFVIVCLDLYHQKCISFRQRFMLEGAH